MGPGGLAAGTIRRYGPFDRDWITGVAADVYRDLGDYRVILPPWLDHPGVATWLEEQGNRDGRVRRGFVLLGFRADSEPDLGLVGELIALAVAPDHQRQGVGRALLRHAIGVAERTCPELGPATLMLTVARDNAVGRRLYESAGFTSVPGDHGCYDSGQVALRMALRLRAGAEQASVAVG